LIRKGFGRDSDFLWITLLKTGFHRAGSLEITGFDWNARKRSNPQNSMKSTTWPNIAATAEPGGGFEVRIHRITTFVHKSSPGMYFFV
jgi:hypothetical protein